MSAVPCIASALDSRALFLAVDVDDSDFWRRSSEWFRRPTTPTAAPPALRPAEWVHGVPNFLSATCPPSGAWYAVELELRRFLRLRVGDDTVSADDQDIFAEVLASPILHALVRDTGGDPRSYPAIVAYARGIARNKRHDVLEARRRQTEAARAVFDDYAAYGARSQATSRSNARGRTARVHVSAAPSGAGRNTLEDATICVLDQRRGQQPLTAAFDVEDFWQSVRDWAARRLRGRFGFAWSPRADHGSRRAIIDERIEGRPLTPEEGTWVSLRSGTRPAITLTTSTTPEDAFKREYEAVYRVFFRARQARSFPCR